MIRISCPGKKESVLVTDCSVLITDCSVLVTDCSVLIKTLYLYEMSVLKSIFKREKFSGSIMYNQGEVYMEHAY